ncbi:hypothetical protein NPIL_383161 [Nephila pilipes]|uniref:Uncharacterized protein n=1 Tax=Nephila pilipes TaxID=299642 RepID=A0A8X6QCH8_NEPPI|nr:hypothetical protein NPIL_383161 [Nephila pilipes]
MENYPRQRETQCPCFKVAGIGQSAAQVSRSDLALELHAKIKKNHCLMENYNATVLDQNLKPKRQEDHLSLSHDFYNLLLRLLVVQQDRHRVLDHAKIDEDCFVGATTSTSNLITSS